MQVGLGNCSLTFILEPIDVMTIEVDNFFDEAVYRLQSEVHIMLSLSNSNSKMSNHVGNCMRF